jgi:hypothetical protein
LIICIAFISYNRAKAAEALCVRKFSLTVQVQTLNTIPYCELQHRGNPILRLCVAITVVKHTRHESVHINTVATGIGEMEDVRATLAPLYSAGNLHQSQ